MTSNNNLVKHVPFKLHITQNNVSYLYRKPNRPMNLVTSRDLYWAVVYKKSKQEERLATRSTN